MTPSHQPLAPLSVDEMLVAIAVACGWKVVPQEAPPYGEFYEKFLYELGERKFVRFVNLPNYLTSLDAMASAESTLTPDERTAYAGWLCNNVFAGPLERAEAFCEVKGITGRVRK